MKITNRFIEPIPLDKINDAADGSRVAMRPGAQTFKGTKTFEALRVASDTEKGDKSLINVADMNYAITEIGQPMTVTESVTLTAEDITGKGTSLQGKPTEGALVTLVIEGSGTYNNILDFNVTDKTVSWAANLRLCDLLVEGDVLNFRYHTIKEAA